ncbi:MAG: glycosyltransferase family 39 protein [Candidatus Omnitrophica bacterium]|nr:glycosyltransferase family 39 protein [Candidatus Omnitrophota bacterium]
MMSVFAVMIFILMNAAVIVSACKAERVFFRFSRSEDILIAVSVLCLAQVVVTGLLLGMAGGLSLAGLFLINAGVCLFLSLLPGVPARGQNGSSGMAASFFDFLTRDKALRFAFAVLAGFGAAKLCMNLVNPPFGWDSLNYHFTFPVEWLKSGGFDTPITVFDDPSPSYYPINGSLVFLWLMAPLKNVFLADIAQFAFFALSLACVYSIAKKTGLQPRSAFLAAALFAAVPNFFKQLEIAYVDIMVAALLLASVHFLLLLKDDFSRKNILGYGLALGLAIGTKTLALAYAAVLAVPFLMILRKEKGRHRLAAFFAVCATLVLVGGFMYIRNFLETSNPFYPLNISVAGKTVFQGVIDPQVYKAHFKPGDYSLAKLLFHEGMGAQTILFLLPGVFLAFPLARARGEKPFGLFWGYFFLLPLLLYLVYRYLIPLPNARYLYACLGLGMVCGVYAFEKARVPYRVILALSLLCILASASELSKRGELIASVCAAFLFFFLSAPLLKYIKKGFATPIRRAALAVVAVLLLGALNSDYIRNEYGRYTGMRRYSGFWPDATAAWQWLDQNTAGHNIAYAGRPVAFPLYGTGFKNDVYYASVNAIDPAKLHYFKAGSYRWGYDFESVHESFLQPQNYRGNADYTVWLANLLRRKTDYLFIYSLHQTDQELWPLEDAWAREHPELFEPLYEQGQIRIYKLRLFNLSVPAEKSSP